MFGPIRGVRLGPAFFCPSQNGYGWSSGAFSCRLISTLGIIYINQETQTLAAYVWMPEGRSKNCEKIGQALIVSATAWSKHVNLELRRLQIVVQGSPIHLQISNSNDHVLLTHSWMRVDSFSVPGHHSGARATHSRCNGLWNSHDNIWPGRLSSCAPCR